MDPECVEPHPLSCACQPSQVTGCYFLHCVPFLVTFLPKAVHLWYADYHCLSFSVKCVYSFSFTHFLSLQVSPIYFLASCIFVSQFPSLIFVFSDFLVTFFLSFLACLFFPLFFCFHLLPFSVHTFHYCVCFSSDIFSHFHHSSLCLFRPHLFYHPSHALWIGLVWC